MTPSAPLLNRQWLMKRHPAGRAVPGDFTAHLEQLVSPELRPGQLLLRNQILLCAPALRNRMDPPVSSYDRERSIRPGEVIPSPVAGVIISSADPCFPPGTRVSAPGHWQDFEVIDSDQETVYRIPDHVTTVEAMGPLGGNALTAYFGITKIGRPEAGDTLLVSGAAGSTGSIAAQIGKIAGCRVIGVAGGAEKCDWLRNEVGLDGAVDYRSSSWARDIRALCPDGIDIFYDNVGGEVLDLAIQEMNRHGRVVVCGQIASYNERDPAGGLNRLMTVVYKSIRVEGFLLDDFAADIPYGRARLETYLKQGRLRHREDVRRGFPALPGAFADLFSGAHRGTLLVDISDSDE